MEDHDEREWVLAGRPESYYSQVLQNVRNRLLEGQGECMCKVGVDSRGRPKGITEEDYNASLETVHRVAADLKAAATLVVEKVVKEAPKLQCAELLVRRVGEDSYIDMRIAICGNVDSGKSTFVGVLTKGVLDNGRGSVRQKVFRHKHEMDTGRTSSVSEQMMGFDAYGKVVNYEKLMSAQDEKLQKHQPSTKQISEQSAKIITFYDLAGHEKYLKTTVLGMTGSMPDYACIVISANNGIQRMTKEHLGLCLALKIPFYVVITRIDMTPEPVTKNTTENVLKLLKHSGVNKLPYMVRKPEDVVICAKNIKDDRIAPIFHVSNVTGDNFDLMRRYLNLLPVRRDWYGMAKEPLEVIIDSTFYVPGVGTVVGGIVTSGVLQSNDTVWLGPNANGHFRQAVVKSIHVKQCLTNHVEAGTAACFAIKKERRSDIRKGMVLVDAKNKPAAVWEFEAEIVVLYHSTTIQSNYQPVVHCGTVRQSCAIILVDRDVLRTGDKARVKFRFMYKPEYVKKGLKLIFREGRTKGLGTITDTFGVRSS
jgi:GTPase